MHALLHYLMELNHHIVPMYLVFHLSLQALAYHPSKLQLGHDQLDHQHLDLVFHEGAFCRLVEAILLFNHECIVEGEWDAEHLCN